MTPVQPQRFLEKCAALGVPTALRSKLLKAAMQMTPPAAGANQQSGLEKAAYQLGFHDASTSLAQLQKR